MADKFSFREVRIEDKPLFDRFLNVYPPMISELTFTNIFCWRHSRKHEFAIFKNHLIISSIDNGQKKFYQPVGKEPIGIIKEILEIFPESQFERVEKSIAEQLAADFVVTPNRNMYDYVYKISDLASLAGDKYQPKRNFIRRFMGYGPLSCILDEKTLQGFFELEEEWCSIKNSSENEKVRADGLAVREALNNFRELGIFGSCIYVKNKIAGFAIGEPLNKDTYVEHFEKANTNFTGAYQYVLNEFARKIPEGFTFLNREQDLGIEGLRKSKLSYYPAKMVEKCSVKKK